MVVVGVDEETTSPSTKKLGRDVKGDLLPWESAEDSLDQRYLKSGTLASVESNIRDNKAYHRVNVASA